MPYKRQGSRMLMFDRQVKGLGRIQCSSGTDKAVEFGRRNGILTKLIEAGHLETLRLFKQGTITIQQLVDADRRGKLLHLSDEVLTHGSLEAAIEEWLADAEIRSNTSEGYEMSLERLIAKCQVLKMLPENPTVADLEHVNWLRLHAKWGASEYSWQNMRIALGSFLGSAKNKGLRSFRTRLMPHVPPPKLPQAPKPVLTPAKFWKLVEHMHEPARPAVVAMAVLGVGPKEYFGITREDLDLENMTVEIRGTSDRNVQAEVKRPKRHRLVAVDPRMWDWIDKAVPTPLKYKWLRIHFDRARSEAGLDSKPGQRKITLYTLRHLSGQAASASGAQLHEIAQHMGHTQLSTTMDYLAGPLAKAAARAIADTLMGPAPSASE